MKYALRFGLVLGALAVPAAAVMAQIESHCLPPEMPGVLFPTWVTALPPFESQELSPPLVKGPARAIKAPDGADGRPDATNVAEMIKEPREAIRLAESAQYKEAAKTGEQLLNRARELYRDYTWDYLGNATAWSFIQTGDSKGAAQAHLLAAARIDDEAVGDYHRAVARMLTQTKKSAEEMKDASTYREELRKALADPLDSLRHSAAAAKKTPHPATFLKYIQDAYAKLRLLTAADPDLAKSDAQGTFREGAQGLVVSVLPAQMADARKRQTDLHATAASAIHSQEVDEWNRDVQALWSKVQVLKRLCRMGNYLERMGLASTGGEASRFFSEAHSLLFVPDKGGMVWQEMGRQKMYEGVAHVDIRQSVPWQETYLSPLGVKSAGPTQDPDHRFKPVDGQMKPMDGKMTPMTEKMKPMGPAMAPKYR
ncbi:MAG: hypothetical protein NTX87_16830 [Planctomycetota bacterium]|nr:hypothetical protein [Planctomycetota bacterium]